MFMSCTGVSVTVSARDDDVDVLTVKYPRGTKEDRERRRL